MGFIDDYNTYNAMHGKALSGMGLGDHLALAMTGSGLITCKNPYFWFVDPKNGSDAYNGDSWQYPFQTIQAAVDIAGDGRGDKIFLLSGRGTDYDDDTVSASLANAYVYINKSDISLIGLGPPNSVIIKPDAAASAGIVVIGSTAERVRIANMTLDATTAANGCIVTESGAHYPTIDNCIFNIVSATDATGIGISFDAGKVSHPVIQNCLFYCGAYTLAGVIVEVQDAAPFGGLLKNCTFISTAAANPGADAINVKDGTGFIIDSCHIHGGAAAQNFVDGIDIDAAVQSTILTGPCYIGGCDNAVTDGGTDTLGATNGVVAIS